MLELPLDLSRVLETAQAEMLAHSSRQLVPKLRQNVYFALEHDDTLRGVRAHGYLAAVTARYVLPIWQNAKPDDHIVEDTIRMAEAVWLRSLPIEAADRQLARAWSYFEQLAGTALGETNAFAGGFTAVKALAENLDRVAFQNLVLPDKATDRDVDPWSSDSALYAAMATSGPVWVSHSDISQRQAFWQWWLASAVPAAWRAASSEPHSP